MPENMPDSYLSDDVQSFDGLFFCGGHVNGLAIVLSQICGVSKIVKDDMTAIRNQVDTAYSFNVIFNGGINPVKTSYLSLKDALAERNTLLVKLEKLSTGQGI